MDINIVPTEILRYIFRFLECKDLIKCCRVSTRWKSIVNSFGDYFWEENCAKEFPLAYKDGYKKSGLLWRELYNSLSLWSNVANAETKVTQIDLGNITEFYVLSNNIISCSQDCIQYDNIVHYDLKTHEIVNDFKIDSKISRYEEDDNVLVIEYSAKKNIVLEILYKSTIDRKTKRKQLFWQRTRKWFLRNGEILYERFDRTARAFNLGRIKVVANGEEINFEKSIVMEQISADLVDIIHKSDEELYVLEIFIDSMSVLSVKDQTCRMICDLDGFDDIVSTFLLDDIGFNWSHPNIYWTLRENYPIKSFKKHKKSAPLAYGRFVITQFDDKPNYIYIFDNPYNKYREVVIHKAQPVKTIYIEGCVPSIKNKIDVIETVNGHKLLVLAKNKLFLVELNH